MCFGKIPDVQYIHIFNAETDAAIFPTKAEFLKHNLFRVRRWRRKKTFLCSITENLAAFPIL